MTYLSVITQHISEFRKSVIDCILINLQKCPTRKGGLIILNTISTTYLVLGVAR